MATLRYPGSKAKLANAIVSFLPYELLPLMRDCTDRPAYVEPFFGSGAVGWEVLSGLADGVKVVINDIDYGVICLWKAVMESPVDLIEKVRSAQLSPSVFHDYKASDEKGIDPVEVGFRKLLLHAMSFSGLGWMAGGPIGGMDASNQQYTIEARWNVAAQESSIRQKNALLSRFDVTISHFDFEHVIRKWDGLGTVFYIDPPYYVKGGKLYKHSFSDSDHERLCALLCEIKGKAIISYDDCQKVRSMYSASPFNIHEQETIYSICGSRKNHELIITNFTP